MSDQTVAARRVVPNLFYPQLAWQESDYARLQARLDCYSDFLVLSKYRAGQVTEKFLVDPVELTAALSSLPLASGLLPRDCLAWGRQEGQEFLAVYLEPQVRLVTVQGEEPPPPPEPVEGGGRSASSGQAWRVPLPGLIFAGWGYRYRLWAVPQRPVSLASRLYRAPCPNVYHNVCQGSAPFPQASAATLWQAVEIFFSSTFNRDLSDGKSRAYPGCILDQWRALAEQGAEVYPLADLIPAQETLGEVLDAG